jgi:hypothetical protein
LKVKHTTSRKSFNAPALRQQYIHAIKAMEEVIMIKTAMFETLIDSAVDNGDGTLTFILDGMTYIIKDTLEISKIAQDHEYIIIY